MSGSRAWKSVLVLAFVCLGVPLWACGTPQPVELPGPIGPAVVSGPHLYAVTAAGRLIDVNLFGLGEKAVKDVAPVLGKDKAFLDVAGGKAVAASPGRIDLIDLAGGKLLRSLDWPGEIDGVGFVGTGRIFVRGRTTVAVVDLESAKTLHTIEFADKARRRIASRGAQCLMGTHLYVGGDNQGTVAVLDLEAGKVIDRLAIPTDAVSGICVVGDKVFVLGLNVCYVRMHHLGWFDRQTKKYTALKLPDALLPECTLAAGPFGSLVLTGPDGAFQYDADGTLIGPIVARDAGRFVGVWTRHALRIDKGWLRAEHIVRHTARSN
jgi:hypothetical protein